MSAVLLWSFLFVVIDAALYNNHSTSITARPYNNTADPPNANQPFVSAEQFIDCKSYRHVRNLSSATTALNAAAPLSFEEYWCEHWASKEIVGGTEAYFYNLTDDAKDFCLSLEGADYSSWVATHPASITQTSSWQPTLTQPCCDTFCYIAASAAQLLYWPTPAPSMNVSILVSSGYTFTSPSVYVVYKNVFASGQCGPVGPDTTTVTVAYGPSEIQSYQTGGLSVTAPIDYAQLWSNCTSQNPGTAYTDTPPSCLDIADPAEMSRCQASWSQFESSVYLEEAHCYPQLVYPTGLQKVDPAWATCGNSPTVGHPHPLYDPPRTLAPATALGPGPTTDPATSKSATPGSSSAGPGPSKTLPPSVSTPLGETIDPWHKSSADPGRPNSSPVVNPPQPSPPDPIPFHAPPSDPSQASPSESNPSQNPSVDDPPNADTLIPGSPLQTPAGDPSKANLPGPGPSEGPQVSDPQVTNDPPNPLPSDGSQSQNPQNPNIATAGPTENAPGAAATPFTTVLQGHSIEAAPSASFVVVDGQSITRGLEPITLSGTPIALSSNGDLLLGSSTIQNLFPTPSSIENSNSNAPAAVAPFTTVAQGHTIEASPSAGVVMIDGQSITRGADPISISGTPIALPSNGDLILGDSTVPNILPTPSIGIASTFSVGTQLLTLFSNEIIVAGTTLKPNDPIVTIAGTPISLGPSALQIGPSNIPLNVPPTITPSPLVTIAGQTYAASQLTDGAVIAGSTLHLGAPTITISGTPISLNPSFLQIGPSSIPLNPPPIITPAPLVTLAGQTVAASQLTDGLVIAGSTLHIGSPAITISGTPISLNPSALIIGTSTIPYQPTSQLITIAGQTYAASQLTDGLVIAGSTLHIGSPATTISGTPISLNPSALLLGTSTIPYQPTPELVSIAGQTYTPTPIPSGLVIAGSTLHIGDSPITISGTPISLQSSALVIGTSTIPFQITGSGSEASSATQGLGGFIFSGLNGGPAQSSATASASASVGNGTGGTEGTTPYLGEGGRRAGNCVGIFGGVLGWGVGCVVFVL